MTEQKSYTFISLHRFNLKQFTVLSHSLSREEQAKCYNPRLKYPSMLSPDVLQNLQTADCGRAHKWLRFSCHQAESPDAFPLEKASSLSSPGLYIQPGLSHPRYRSICLFLWSFTQLVTAQHSSLSRPFFVASLLWNESTTPPSVVSSTNLYSILSSPVSVFYIITL